MWLRKGLRAINENWLPDEYQCSGPPREMLPPEVKVFMDLYLNTLYTPYRWVLQDNSEWPSGMLTLIHSVQVVPREDYTANTLWPPHFPGHYRQAHIVTVAEFCDFDNFSEAKYYTFLQWLFHYLTLIRWKWLLCFVYLFTVFNIMRNNKWVIFDLHNFPFNVDQNAQFSLIFTEDLSNLLTPR